MSDAAYSGLRDKSDAVYQSLCCLVVRTRYEPQVFTQRLAKLGIAVDKGRRYYEGLALIKEADEPAEKTIRTETVEVKGARFAQFKHIFSYARI